jgi:hypothetical protein
MLLFFRRLFRSNAAPPLTFTESPLENTEGQEPVAQASRPWIGVDLDGTLAHSDRWRGPQHIGRPVPLMMERVKHWLSQGYTVKIMTARASVKAYIPPVRRWLEKHGLPSLEVTCQKDFDMIELWDDRAIQVIPNTGRHVLRPSLTTMPKAPILPHEAKGKTCQVETGPTR